MPTSDLKWIALTLASLLAACAGDQDPLEQEVERFATASSSQSLVQACQALDQLCKSSGKGCKAYSMFCTQQGGGLLPDLGLPTPPTAPGTGSIKQMICSNLKQACSVFPLACTIYNKHCAGQGAPAQDAGAWPQLPDFQLPQLPDFQLPQWPDFQLPQLPGLDKAKCCAALSGCIQQNDATCAAAQGVCGPQLPVLPGSMQMMLLKSLHKTLCSP